MPWGKLRVCNMMVKVTDCWRWSRVVTPTCAVFRPFTSRSYSTRSSWWFCSTSCAPDGSTCRSMSSVSCTAVSSSSSSGLRHSSHRYSTITLHWYIVLYLSVLVTANPWYRSPPAWNQGPAFIRCPACISMSALQQTDGRQHVSPNNRVFRSGCSQLDTGVNSTHTST